MAQTNYAQALSSVDPNFVTQTRSSYKGKVTRAINALYSALIHSEHDQTSFDHKNIDHDEVIELAGELKSAKEAISELHTRYEVIRVSPDDDQAEEALVNTDSQYIGESEIKIRSCLKKFNAYMHQCRAKDNIRANKNSLALEASQYPLKLQLFKSQQLEYEAC